MVMRSSGKAWLTFIGVALLLFVLGMRPAMAAYRAHGNDRDLANFLQAFPRASNTKLDDCYLCHSGGQVGQKNVGSCDYCHLTHGLRPPHGEVPLNGALPPGGAASGTRAARPAEHEPGP